MRKRTFSLPRRAGEKRHEGTVSKHAFLQLRRTAQYLWICHAAVFEHVEGDDDRSFDPLALRGCGVPGLLVVSRIDRCDERLGLRWWRSRRRRRRRADTGARAARSTVQKAVRGTALARCGQWLVGLFELLVGDLVRRRELRPLHSRSRGRFRRRGLGGRRRGRGRRLGRRRKRHLRLLFLHDLVSGRRCADDRRAERAVNEDGCGRGAAEARARLLCRR